MSGSEYAPPSGSARIVVRCQKGPGYWAVIYWPDGRRQAVQSGAIYGFATHKEARLEAERIVSQNACGNRAAAKRLGFVNTLNGGSVFTRFVIRRFRCVR